MRTLRLYSFTVEILDEATDSDDTIAKELQKAVNIYMEAVKTVVTLVDASDLQVKEDEFGHPILAEA